MMRVGTVSRAVGAAVMGLAAVALASSPAVAAPSWQAWVPSAHQQCGDTEPTKTSNNVSHQTCYITNPTNGTAQPVLIIRNSASVAISVTKVHVWMPTYGSDFETCYDKKIWPGEVAACYGRTGKVYSLDSAVSFWNYNGRYEETDVVKYR